MSVGKYREKPVVIEALQWNGCNWNEMVRFMIKSKKHAKLVGRRIRVPTIEGCIYADELDYIIKGIEGEYYPCKPDIFEKTYEKVAE